MSSTGNQDAWGHIQKVHLFRFTNAAHVVCSAWLYRFSKRQRVRFLFVFVFASAEPLAYDDQNDVYLILNAAHLLPQMVLAATVPQCIQK